MHSEIKIKISSVISEQKMNSLFLLVEISQIQARLRFFISFASQP